MLLCWYKDGKWGEPIIKPYGKLEFTPAMSIAHYGQGIFEGMKAYKSQNDEVHPDAPLLFRLHIRVKLCQLIVNMVNGVGEKCLVDIDRSLPV